MTKIIIAIIIVVGVLAVGNFLFTNNQEVREAVVVEEENMEEVDTSVSEVEEVSVMDDDVAEVTKEEVGSMVDTAPGSDEVADEMVDTESFVNTDTGARATAMIAGGCFWCVEADIEKLQGVLTAVSGYASGDTENPTYQNYDDGGHREVVLVTYNPSVVSYREIVISALKHMDPTDADGSFGDRGYEYSPALYYQTDAERQVVEEVIAAIDALEVYDDPIAAEVLSEPEFWAAEDYHQDYYKGLSSLKYKFYRKASGRDAFIDKHWGDDTDATLPNETSPYDVSAWEGFVSPSDTELLASLTPLQYKVTQNSGTERSFNNEYWDNHEDGIYVDIVSGEPLYSSTDKFDSGTGWPSFTKGLYPDAVTKHDDFKLVVKRTEVRSQFADSHLGHVFNDAPPELGGIRHCINSAALRFVPKADMENEGYGEFLDLF